MTARFRAALVLAMVAWVFVASACSEDPAFLSDEAACPGEHCTADTQDRYDAIAGLERVTEVVSVERSSGLDRGSSSGALVRAEVTTRERATAVATAVLRELHDWPDHPADVITATVESDPPVTVDYVARDDLGLGSAYFESCAPQECARALDDLSDGLPDQVDGLSDVGVARRGDTLRVSGRAAPETVELAARGIRSAFFDLALALADRVQIVVRARGPLEVTLRLDGDLVCPQPPGDAVVECEEDNSVSFDQ